MVNIEKICNDFITDLSKHNNPQEVLEDCIYNKLNTLYTQQSEKYDNMIETIYNMVDMDDISNICSVLNKLSKNINSNRQQLISLMERLD